MQMSKYALMLHVAKYNEHLFSTQKTDFSITRRCKNALSGKEKSRKKFNDDLFVLWLKINIFKKSDIYVYIS
jgi:hypothetical protein